MIKSTFLIAQFIYLIIFGLLSWHLKDNFLTLLWLSMILFYVISVIFLKRYLFIILFFISSCMLFTLGNNPYTYYVIRSGVVEKKISYEDNTIFFIEFYDRSTVTVLYGKNKQCIGRQYENKTNCLMIISMLEANLIR